MGSSSSTAAATTSYGVPTIGSSSSSTAAATTSYGVPTIGSCPPSFRSCAYEVFLSFRGADIRKTFIDHLYQALVQHSIYTFKDDEKLEGGEPISDQLLKAIEQSRSTIVVFSKGYASSPWCLDELEKIMDCKDKLGLAVYPVFYDVPPSDVRGQRGAFGRGFAQAIERKADKEDVWRKALRDAANLSGKDVQNTADGHESHSIKQIVKWFWDYHGNIVASSDENLIGINPRVQKVVSLLGIDSVDDVKMIGIWGMGGAGKTTVATVVFDEIRMQFDGASFIESVRENSQKFGLPYLQKTILSNILKDEDLNVNRISEGTQMLRIRLGCKKVLIVLDDVDDIKQLEALAGDRNWFGKGSRILITTRDEQLLVAHGIDELYNVDLLDENEAIQLFRRHAFKKCSPTQGYDELSLNIARYAAGLPLTLKVLSSLLCDRGEDEWTDALERLKTFPEETTFEILKISYDSLKVDERDLFLDIACFFKGEYRDKAIRILESQGYHTKIGISILQQKCLITFADTGRIQMHDLIEEMGKKIVSDSDPKEPGKWSRLWRFEDIDDVLGNNKAIAAVEAIVGCWYSDEHTRSYDSKAFMSMKKLRLLHLSNSWKYSFHHRPPCSLPNELQWLTWEGYPFESLAESFQATKLVGLVMPESKIVQLWEGKKLLYHLKFLNLRNSEKLIRTPDFSGIPNLIELNLNNCTSLVEVHSSLGGLQKLVSLDLRNCINLVEFPSNIHMKSLEILNLSSCRKFKRFPELCGNMDRLSELRLDDTAIEGLPSSIANLTNLVSIDLCLCNDLLALPDTICTLKNIKNMNLRWCEKLGKLPENLGDMERFRKLDISGSGVEELPSSIVHLKNLKALTLVRCEKIRKLPENLGDMESLQELVISQSGVEELPSSIVHLKNIKYLNLFGCEKLGKLPENLGDMESLRELYLWESGVEVLPSSIVHLKNIKYLNLSGCEKLGKLPENLGDMERLEKLNISQSGVEELPSSIVHLKNIKYLNLSGCEKLGKLPENLGDMESLQELVIRKSGVEELPSSIVHLKNIKYLNLSGCEKLGKLPENLGDMERLEKLDISQSGVEVLPSSIVHLKNIKYLNLSGCEKLGKLPENLGDMESLQELVIRKSGVEELPSSIVHLKNIKYLNLSGCEKLGKLPENLGDIESLRELYLWESGVEVLPSSIVHLKNITYLNLSGCEKLGKLPENLGDMESLEVLSLGGSGVEELPSSIVHLKNLKKLHLYWCKKLGKLPENLGDMERLEKLYLWGSGVEELPSSIVHLKNLKYLNLSWCKKIRKLPENLGDIESLEELCISESGVEELPSSIVHLKELGKLRVFW